MISNTHKTKVAIVASGGTGGHIFPGLAVANALIQNGWQVHWLGSKFNMEWDIIRSTEIPFESIDFSGVRGKSVRTLISLPWRLLRALVQTLRIMRRVKPQVLLGFGGYITVPAGLVGAALGVPLILHEQNRVAGMANRVLSRLARRVFTAFPDALPSGQWVGNPLRDAFGQCPPPTTRFASREGPLRLLIVGGSLGAGVLNEAVPRAIAQLPCDQRPVITHQSGKAHLHSLEARYASFDVGATVVPFIDDMASAFAAADLVICRAGASTVTEVAAVGVACLFVPLPSAVDDHQTANAKYLAQHDGAWLMPQSQLTPEALATFIQNLTRERLTKLAQNAYTLRKMDAVKVIVDHTAQIAS